MLREFPLFIHVCYLSKGRARELKLLKENTPAWFHIIPIMLFENSYGCCWCPDFLNSDIVLFFSEQLCDLPLGIAATVENWLELKKKKCKKNRIKQISGSRIWEMTKLKQYCIDNVSSNFLKGARTYQRRMPTGNHQICKYKLGCFFTENWSNSK